MWNSSTVKTEITRRLCRLLRINLSPIISRSLTHPRTITAWKIWRASGRAIIAKSRGLSPTKLQLLSMISTSLRSRSGEPTGWNCSQHAWAFAFSDHKIKSTLYLRGNQSEQRAKAHGRCEGDINILYIANGESGLREETRTSTPWRRKKEKKRKKKKRRTRRRHSRHRNWTDAQKGLNEISRSEKQLGYANYLGYVIHYNWYVDV